MRMLWTLVRILVLLASLATLVVTVLFVSSSTGTSIDPGGAVVDAIALVILVFVGWSLWRDRRALV
jgi:flagellar biosynthesis protein FliP